MTATGRLLGNARRRPAGLIGVLVCIGGIIGCWSLRTELTRRLDRIFARVDGSLAGIGGDILRARDGLLSARQELGAARRDKAGPPGPSNERGGRPSSAGKAIGSVGQRLGEAEPHLVRAVEFGLVANGLLEALSDLWLTERRGWTPIDSTRRPTSFLN